MHKVYVFTVVVGMYKRVFAKKMQREEQKEYLCIAVFCWNESEQAGGSVGMRMRVVEGGGSWALVWRVFGGPGSLRS